MSKRKASLDIPQRAAKRAVINNDDDDDESSDDSDRQMDQSQRPDFQTHQVISLFKYISHLYLSTPGYLFIQTYQVISIFKQIWWSFYSNTRWTLYLNTPVELFGMVWYRDPVFFLFICQHLRPYCSGLFRCDIAFGRILVIQTHLVSSVARHLKHTGQVSFVFRLFIQTNQANLNKADHFFISPVQEYRELLLLLWLSPGHYTLL